MTTRPPRLVLLPSPLVGPAAWWTTAAALMDRGWDTTALRRSVSAPRTACDVLRHFAQAVPADQPVVVVAHGDAGLYVPALRTARRVVAAVYVDAVIPGGAGPTRTTDPPRLALLKRMADTDRLVPKWLRWWTPAERDRLLPDLALQAALEEEQHRVPLSYFRSTVTTTPDWGRRSSAYLALGDDHDLDRVRAARAGWPTATRPGTHLATMTDPEAVATAISELTQAVLRQPPRPSVDAAG